MPQTDEAYDLTTGAAADLLGVEAPTVIRYVKDRGLPCRVLPSGHRRFRRSDVEALLNPAASTDPTGDAT